MLIIKYFNENEVLYISKQLSCQKYIFKIHSSRLRKEQWNLTLSLEEARKNDDTVTAKDSRDRTSNAKHTSAITVYDYAKPSITTFTVMRDSADASKVIAKAKWNYSSVNKHSRNLCQ